VLEAAAAATPEVRARGLNSMLRGVLNRFDDTAAESRSRLGEANLKLIPRHSASDEDHVAVNPADPFPTEREVVDRDSQ